MVQYIVKGNKLDFKKRELEKNNIHISKDHPPTGQKDDHFVIELLNITLPWNYEDNDTVLTKVEELL